MGIAGLFGGPYPGYRRPLTRLAAPIIIATGERARQRPGADTRVEDFACFVAADQVRYALIGDGSDELHRVFGGGGQRALTDWIRDHGRVVDPAQWRSASNDIGGRRAESVGAMLYDLRPESAGG